MKDINISIVTVVNKIILVLLCLTSLPCLAANEWTSADTTRGNNLSSYRHHGLDANSL
jgi:hypothetical protein